MIQWCDTQSTCRSKDDQRAVTELCRHPRREKSRTWTISGGGYVDFYSQIDQQTKDMTWHDCKLEAASRIQCSKNFPARAIPDMAIAWGWLTPHEQDDRNDIRHIIQVDIDLTKQYLVKQHSWSIPAAISNKTPPDLPRQWVELEEARLEMRPTADTEMRPELAEGIWTPEWRSIKWLTESKWIYCKW